MAWRSSALAVLVATAMWAVAVGGADAHTTRIPSTLELTDFPDTDGDGTPEAVAGVVGSPSAKCKRGRTVKIYWIGNDDAPQGSLILIDTVRTDRQGRWQGGNVEPIGRGGVVKLLPKNIGRNGHKHICKGRSAVYD